MKIGKVTSGSFDNSVPSLGVCHVYIVMVRSRMSLWYHTWSPDC